MADEDILYISGKTIYLPHTHEDAEKECAVAILAELADRDILSFPQLSHYTGYAPSMLHQGLHILSEDAPLINVKEDPKIHQNFYTLSDEGTKLKSSISLSNLTHRF
jgi:hypothetical protein